VVFQELLGDALLELQHLRCKDGLSAKTISLLEWRLQLSEKEADVGLGSLQRASEQVRYLRTRTRQDMKSGIR
jgi:hypothetical protein